MFKQLFTAAWMAMMFACCQLAAAASSISVSATSANPKAPANITLSISQHADPDPVTITQVEYFHGSTSLGVVASAPFSLAMSNVAAGTYAIVARASTTDANNPVLQSAPLQVTVAAPAGSATAYFIHTDQLNTPRAITNGSGALVWQWDGDPFGKDAANEQPAGQNAFVFNLRFPGQQFDRESNLHYNYYRVYDPQTGRYIQSDPIGLAGGLNTYGYVGGNPLGFSDPKGLAAVGVAVGVGVRVVGGRVAVAAIGATARRYGLGGRIAACLLAGVSCMEEAEEACPEGTNTSDPKAPPQPGEIPTLDWKDPTKPPVGPNGEEWVWRGKPPQGGDKGGYVNPSNPDQSAHPDLNHPPPVGPHWDYTDRNKTNPGWRVYPDGKIDKK